MNFVLDTNVVNELRKPRPEIKLLHWLGDKDPGHLFITTITEAEVWRGFCSISSQHRDYEGIKIFASELSRKYRILNFDSRAAAIWGEMTAHASGPLPLRDSFIGAIVLSRGYRIVTRDTKPFERMGCKVVDPWE